MQPKVSVIVPIYNVEDYLPGCIESIVNQTLEDIEIILVNDGSKDGSGEIADIFASKDTRISVVHKQNEGVSSARNVGLELARGHYIVFVDSDDFIEPNMLEDMFNYAYRQNVDIVISGKIIEYTRTSESMIQRIEKQSISRSKEEIGQDVFLLCKQSNFDVIWNKLYKTDLINKKSIRFNTRATTSEDLLFNVEVFTNVSSILLIEEVYYHYMNRDEVSLVSSYHKNMYNIMEIRNLAYQSLFDHFKLTSVQNKEWLINEYQNSVHLCVLNLYRKNHKISYLDKIKYVKKNIIQNKKVNAYLDNWQPNDLLGIIFKKLLKIKSPIFIISLYDMLFFLRYSFEPIYIKIRNKFYV